jgi:hypothetical protein
VPLQMEGVYDPSRFTKVPASARRLLAHPALIHIGSPLGERARDLTCACAGMRVWRVQLREAGGRS